MTEVSGRTGRSRTLVALSVVAALVIGGVVWAFVVVSAQSGSPGPAPVSPVAAESLPPQPTSFPTPEPGSTEAIEKPVADPADETAIGETAEVDGQVVVEVVEFTEEDSVGDGLPGEVAGPGYRVVVRVTNNGSVPVDTTGAAVNLTYGGDEALPAVAVAERGVEQLPSMIAPGASATGVFVFGTSPSVDGEVRVTVDLLAHVPDVVFVGN